MRSFSGAFVRRVIDRSHVQVPEHVHDWPVLSLFVMGSYLNETEIGERFIASPSAVFYRARAPHRNTSGTVGFEQLEVEFDPAWIGADSLPSAPAQRWIGGRAGTEVRGLIRACEQAASEQQLRCALRHFMADAMLESDRAPAPWVGTITRRLQQSTRLQAGELAREVGRHPSWMGTAYRHAMGESVQQTAARFRVEHATRLLRESELSYAAIALEAGFCDQSHMNRTFRRVLGRSPGIIRQDRLGFRLDPSFPGRASNCI